MKRQGCTVREHTVGPFRAVTLENESLAVTVLPEKGADIYALVSKPHKVDVLWKSPWGLKRGAAIGSESAWLDQYEGGWQVLFPNAGDACSYRGADLHFHGEASVREWDWTVRSGSTQAEMEMFVDLSRLPFRISRTVRIERSLAAVLIDEKIENRGEEDLHFLWAQHPAFGAPFLAGECRIQIPASGFTAHELAISPSQRVAAGVSGPWPNATPEVDLSILPPAGQRVTEFGYITNIEQGWYAVTNERLNLGFGLAWPKDLFPYLWFWQELRGSFGYPWYGRCYVMAIEPATSIPASGLGSAVERGTAPLLRAGSSITAHFAAALFDSATVDGIAPDGTVSRKAEEPA